ncbi:IS5 family transposase [Methanoculleus bourgensis]|uniref:IS5 family transposase n=1 Tax=Methanoculleus bourgensis TaxID=83986 RepID=UPI0022ED7DFE|nr:IS5 family transposase [Methanoculleus bourgensis]GLI45979.1 IS5 family transposase [Methanoculleus bourgensis]
MSSWSSAANSLLLDFVDQWDAQLAQMNAGKRGRPFQYPESFIAWMARIHIFLQMPYRQIEGFVRKLATFIPSLKAANYTTLFCRIKNLDLSLEALPEILADDVIVGADSTGIKVTNRGEWMREKWGARRGWIKVHLMIDVETNQALGLEITDEAVQDDQRFIPLLDQTQQNCGEEHPVYRVLADGAYDRNELFNALEHRGIASGIKTRVNAATHSTRSPYRAECVRNRKRWGGYPMWALVVTYGMRWKVEGAFSTIKRILGEQVQATSREGMFREVRMKVNSYNRLIALAA